MKKSTKKFLDWKKIIPKSQENPIGVAKSGIYFDSELNKIYIFGGSELDSTKEAKLMNQFFSFDLQEQIWEKIEPTSKKSPKPRSALSMCGFKNKMWIFGGHFESKFYNDLWEFNSQTNEWKKIKTDNNESQPEPRYSHSIIYHNAYIYVFGGVLSDGSRKNDVWKFNTLEPKWEIIKTKGKIPDPRSSHTCHIYEDNLLIFGGLDKSVVKSMEIFLLDLKLFEWKQIHPILDIPAIGGHISMIYENQYLVCFGGFSWHSRYSNKLSYYDLKSNEWFLYQYYQNQLEKNLKEKNQKEKNLKENQLEKTKNSVPSPRFGSVGCHISRSSFFVFGGQYENSISYDEIWIFSFEHELVCDFRNFLELKVLVDF
ncbi:hypothetical protein M0811_01412 [Anaeramoeba ignava]|uniref:Uncharacterized protein n=1 Tax=Anaeramoeba ignava TaxID=1746090 RepID=A0A9Q0LJ67_ANAIG|nr:hypothetical protein M0811_01412 [Anaeramoeba ignava]